MENERFLGWSASRGAEASFDEAGFFTSETGSPRNGPYVDNDTVGQLDLTLNFLDGLNSPLDLDSLDLSSEVDLEDIFKDVRSDPNNNNNNNVSSYSAEDSIPNSPASSSSVTNEDMENLALLPLDHSLLELVLPEQTHENHFSLTVLSCKDLRTDGPDSGDLWKKNKWRSVEIAVDLGGKYPLWISDKNWYKSNNKKDAPVKQPDDLEVELVLSSSGDECIPLASCSECFTHRLVDVSAKSRRLEETHFFLKIRIHCLPGSHQAKAFFLWLCIKNGDGDVIISTCLPITKIAASRSRKNA